MGKRGLSHSITANRHWRPNAACGANEAARNSQFRSNNMQRGDSPTPFELGWAAKGDKMSIIYLSNSYAETK